MKLFNALAIYCGKAYSICDKINNLKTMGGGHAVHEQQAILLTMVVIFVRRMRKS